MKVEAARREHATQPPCQAPVVQHKVRLLVSAPAAQPKEEGGENLPMELDEESEVSFAITGLVPINF